MNDMIIYGRFHVPATKQGLLAFLLARFPDRKDFKRKHKDQLKAIYCNVRSKNG